MHKTLQDKTSLALSLLLGLLVAYVSYTGLHTQHFYSKETPNWQAQSIGQDMVDLFIIEPVLFITAILGYKGSKTARLMHGGVVFYLTYTFLLYCFDVHFNKLFVLYCACLGLSFYASLEFLFTLSKTSVTIEGRRFIRFTGIYFITIAILFSLLWLSEIIPAVIQGNTPKSITEAGLFTNGVHVIDLSIFLPGTLITGILLIKKPQIGIMLTPALLTFFILMDVTIGILVLIMKGMGIESNMAIAIVMALLAVMSLVLLILFSKIFKVAC